METKVYLREFEYRQKKRNYSLAKGNGKETDENT